MNERPDFGRAIREALPVYEASPSLEAWARGEARKLDEQAVPQRAPLTRSVRGRIRRFSQWPVAAGLVIAAAAGWSAASLRPAARATAPTNETTSELVDAHVRSL